MSRPVRDYRARTPQMCSSHRNGTRRAYGVQVLTLRDSRVAGVVAFLAPVLFPAFGLAPKLPAAGLSVAPGQ